MIKYFLWKCALVGFFTLISQPLFSDSQGNKVEPGEFPDVLVEVRELGDLPSHLSLEHILKQAPKIEDRRTRIRFVYDSLSERARLSQIQIRKQLQEKNIPHTSFHIENVIRIRKASSQVVAWLETLPGVVRVRKDVEIRMREVPVAASDRAAAEATLGSPGHINMIRADKVWNELGIKGRGIIVGGQDTGYYWQHNSIRRQYRGFNSGKVAHDYNWFDGTGQLQEPSDDRSHGTHTMGTILGDDGRDNKIGVAPEAQWIGCKNMINGVGTVSSYLSCFQFFLAPHPRNGNPAKDGKPELAPHIINNSWACPPKEGCSGEEFLNVVRTLRAAGIMVVAAAGNDGPSCGSITEAPAMYTGELISVGAYNRYQQDIAFFSSRGPSRWSGKTSPDLIAPGEIIRSAVTGSPDSYDDKAGTSMASPQIAGVIALLWSAKPELVGKIEATWEILFKTAKRMNKSDSCGGGNRVPNSTFGYGMVDAYAAITYRTRTEAIRPTPTREP